MKQFILVSALIAALGMVTTAQAHIVKPDTAPIDTTIFDDMGD